LIEELGTPKIWDVWPQIRMLQEILIEMWFLKTKSTAIYGQSTKAAVAAFQKSTWLIIESNDPHAGVLGTLTRKKLVEEILYRGIEV
jgi:peptidoglycan hydrolase-like protein with peptidoglycan-binding domain